MVPAGFFTKVVSYMGFLVDNWPGILALFVMRFWDDFWDGNMGWKMVVIWWWKVVDFYGLGTRVLD